MKKIKILGIIILVLLIGFGIYTLYNNYKRDEFIKKKYEQYYESYELTGVVVYSKDLQEYQFLKDPYKKKKITKLNNEEQQDMLSKINDLPKDYIKDYKEIIVTTKKEKVKIKNDNLIFEKEYLNNNHFEKTKNIIFFKLLLDNAKHEGENKINVETIGNVYENSLLGNYINKFWKNNLAEFNEASINNKLSEFSKNKYNELDFINEAAALSPIEEIYQYSLNDGINLFYQPILIKNQKNETVFQMKSIINEVCEKCETKKTIPNSPNYGTDVITYEFHGNYTMVDAYSTDELATTNKIIDLIKILYPERYLKNIKKIIFYDHMDKYAASIDAYSEKMTLNVSLKTFYENNEEEIIPVLIHELGHEILIERNNSVAKKYRSGIGLDFQNTFWTSSLLENCLNNSICDDLYNQNDFITKYAATNILEDTASSFAFYVLSDPPRNNLGKDQKIKFLNNYEQMINDRNELRENILKIYPYFNFGRYNVNRYIWY